MDDKFVVEIHGSKLCIKNLKDNSTECCMFLDDDKRMGYGIEVFRETCKILNWKIDLLDLKSRLIVAMLMVIDDKLEDCDDEDKEYFMKSLKCILDDVGVVR